MRPRRIEWARAGAKSARTQVAAQNGIEQQHLPAVKLKRMRGLAAALSNAYLRYGYGFYNHNSTRGL
jgi:hypothetical protein